MLHQLLGNNRRLPRFPHFRLDTRGFEGRLYFTQAYPFLTPSLSSTESALGLPTRCTEEAL